MQLEELRAVIRDIPNHPIDGVTFRDITPLLSDSRAFESMVDRLARVSESVDVVVGVEARGFIVGAPVAHHLGVGFVPVRKPGKLPWKTFTATYSLEYGVDALEIHQDAIEVGTRVLIVDDVLATGGTATATVDLIEMLGGEVVGLHFVIELDSLGGRDRLLGRSVQSLLHFP